MTMAGRDRRMHPRYLAPYRVVVTAAEAKALAALTDDVSAGGLFLATSHSLPLDEPLDLTLHLPDGMRAIRCSGRVIRRAAADEARQGYGVQLEFASTEGAIDYVNRINALRDGQVSAEPERYTVLVVEDNDMVREVVSSALPVMWHKRYAQGPDLCVRMAESGDVALAMLAESEDFRLVICDVYMPNLDGRGFVAALRDDPRLRHVPVLAISAADVGDEMMALDVDAFLPKPLRLQELFVTVHTLLAGQYQDNQGEEEQSSPLERAVRDVCSSS